jgi:hypothetical protein
MIDVQIHTDFKAIAELIGCNFKASFISSLNDGGIEYPLMLLTPISTTEDLAERLLDTVDVTMYFFRLNQTTGGETLNETEMWTVFGELSNYVKAFKSEMLKMEFLEKYVITSKIKTSRNAFRIGYDDTVFVKVTFTMEVYSDC